MEPVRLFAALLAAGVALAQEQRPDYSASQETDPQLAYRAPPIFNRDGSLLNERFGKLLDYRFYTELIGVHDSSLAPRKVHVRAMPTNTSVDSSQETDQQPAYPGPPILNRDRSLLNERHGKLLDYRFYTELLGVYDSGLAPLSTDARGDQTNVGVDGIETGFGVIASRRSKHDKFSVEYKGAFRQYSSNDVVHGLDQFLNLNYGREFSRRLTLNVKATAGSVSLANGAFTYLPLTNNDLFAIPLNELFDIQTRFAQSRLDLVSRQTARLSFDFGGEGFVVRRSSLALTGLDGYNAHANAAYRLTLFQTFTAGYEYTYFDFQRAFGNSRIQIASLGYAVALSRNWDLSFRGGGIRIDGLGITEVAIDPSIAAIVGQNFANVTFARSNYLPLVESRLTRRLNQASLTFSYLTGVTPGNGVYLTSRQNAAQVSYFYAGFRRWSAGFNAGYNDLSPLGQTLGKYTNLQGGTAMRYRLAPDTYAQFRYDYRHYTTQNNFYQKDSNRVSLGLVYSPGDRPLEIW